jgi:hypothetical protein
MRKIIVLFAVAATFGALGASPALAASPHFIGSRSCTFSASTGDLTCSFKVAGLGNVSQATIQLVFNFECTNRGGHNPPGQASTQPTTVPVSNGQITLTNFTFSSNASCPDKMTPSAGSSASLFVNGVFVGTIPITNIA